METTAERLGILAVGLTMMGIGASPYPLLLILCYGIHELGHIVASRLCKAKIRKIKAGVFHLSMSYDCQGLTYKKEILVLFGGIIFNLVSAFLVYILPIPKTEAKEFFIVASVSLALMNLYPVSVLDGGGILRAVLLMTVRYDVAEKISRTLYFIFALILWFVSSYFLLVFSGSLSLFLISVLLLMKLCLTF